MLNFQILSMTYLYCRVVERLTRAIVAMGRFRTPSSHPATSFLDYGCRPAASATRLPLIPCDGANVTDKRFTVHRQLGAIFYNLATDFVASRVSEQLFSYSARNR